MRNPKCRSALAVLAFSKAVKQDRWSLVALKALRQFYRNLLGKDGMDRGSHTKEDEDAPRLVDCPPSAPMAQI